MQRSVAHFFEKKIVDDKETAPDMSAKEWFEEVRELYLSEYMPTKQFRLEMVRRLRLRWIKYVSKAPISMCEEKKTLSQRCASPNKSILMTEKEGGEGSISSEELKRGEG